MPQFLLDPADLDPSGGTAILRGDEARHLSRVLRARPGERVDLFDGRGRRWRARLSETDRATATLEDLESLRPNEPPLELEVIQALPKGERWEWILEKGTELGVRRFHPVETTRTVARVPPPRLSDKRTRWAKVVLAAAKQCERALIPEVMVPTGLGDCLRGLGPARAGELRLALAERRPRSRGGAPPGPLGRVVLAAGPEGGWSEDDRETLAEAGFAPWNLGPRILRSETAATSALAVILSIWGDLEPPGAP